MVDLGFGHAFEQIALEIAFLLLELRSLLPKLLVHDITFVLRSSNEKGVAIPPTKKDHMESHRTVFRLLRKSCSLGRFKT